MWKLYDNSLLSKVEQLTKNPLISYVPRALDSRFSQEVGYRIMKDYYEKLTMLHLTYLIEIICNIVT